MAEHTTGNRVDVDEPLMEAGLDSLGAVELRDLLAAASGAALPDTLIFDFPTPRKLVACLEGNAIARQPSLIPQLSQAGEALLAGRSARLPRGVETPLATQRMLECGSDTIGEVPLKRWPPDAVPPMPEPIEGA